MTAEKVGQVKVRKAKIPRDVMKSIRNLTKFYEAPKYNGIVEAEAIREILETTGWSQAELARMLGTSESRVSVAVKLSKAPQDFKMKIILEGLGLWRAVKLLQIHVAVEEQKEAEVRRGG